MNWQVPEEPCLGLRSPEHNRLSRFLRKIYSETRSKKLIHIKAGRHAESLGSQVYTYHSVKTVHPHRIPFQAISDDIPSFRKLLHGIRPQGVGTRLRTGVFLICDLYLIPFRHSLEDSRQMSVSRRNILHRHTTRKSFPAKIQQIVDCKCVNQPCRLCVLVSNILGILDEISVRATIAFNPDAEHLLHSLAMIVERATRILTVKTALPSVEHLFQTKPLLASPDECLHQPDVLSE